jgi:hypothetical protein
VTDSDFLAAVVAERARQDAKFPDCSDLPDSDSNPVARATFEAIARNACNRAYREGRCTFSHVLEEEAAEVLTAAAEGDVDALERELVQVAAVCKRWLEAIARRRAG